MNPNVVVLLSELDLWKKTREAITEKTEIKWEIDAGGQANARQKQSIATLLNQYYDRHSLSRPERYEYKQIFIRECDWGHVSIVLEVGSRSDEGTVASLIARDRVHAFIGPKGGFRAPRTGKRGGHDYVVGLFAVCSIYKG